jgi:hypothetical protein
MPVCKEDADCREALARFFHEMGGEPTTQPKLSVTPSGLPAETTTVLLESRGKVAVAGAPAESAEPAPA